MESTKPAATPVMNIKGQPQIGISSILHFCRESQFGIKRFRERTGCTKPPEAPTQATYPD